MQTETIWKKHKTHLFNFIKTTVSDFDTAEDILQDVRIKLHENLTGKSNIKNPETWLFQVTRNTIADYYMKEKVQLNKINNEALYSMKSEPGAPCICDLSGFIILEYMPKEFGVPLYLSDIEHIPQKDIAKILNLSLAATKSRIQRARKKLTFK